MGQYFKYFVMDTEGNRYTDIPWKHNNGAKMMEHSWLLNNYVNIVANHIFNHPCRVAWIGDYSIDEDTRNNFSDCITRAEFQSYYYCVWEQDTYPALDNDKRIFNAYFTDSNGIEVDHSEQVYAFIRRCFLINHTKHTYINMNEYFTNNAVKGWCINPIPLLTCIKGGGCGDYHGINEHLLGTWALDLLEIKVAEDAKKSEKFRNTYTKEIVKFKESYM